jgi:hypothetical protein
VNTGLFCVITKRVLVIYCRRFGTTYRVPSSGFKNTPKERSSQLLRGGSLKSRNGWMCAPYGCFRLRIFLWPLRLPDLPQISLSVDTIPVTGCTLVLTYRSSIADTKLLDHISRATKLTILRTANCIKNNIFFRTVKYSQQHNKASTMCRQSV